MGPFSIGDIFILPLVVGLTEFAKKLGVKGNWSMVLAMVLGTVFVALSEAIKQGLVPDSVLPFITIAVVGLGGGLASTGLYDLSKYFRR